jgi:hypothetical protein
MKGLTAVNNKRIHVNSFYVNRDGVKVFTCKLTAVTGEVTVKTGIFEWDLLEASRVVEKPFVIFDAACGDDGVWNREDGTVVREVGVDAAVKVDTLEAKLAYFTRLLQQYKVDEVAIFRSFAVADNYNSNAIEGVRGVCSTTTTC